MSPRDPFHRAIQDLLGLSGKPLALSSIPISARPQLDLPMIGRTEDLNWLAAGSGDRILVGQPGSGKTHLLRQLTERHKAYFVVDDDRAALATALLDLEPSMVIVDDAFVEPRLLTTLQHLRGQRRFDILAVTWPGQLTAVRAALGSVASEKIRTLEGMTRGEMRQLFAAGGIHGPEDLVLELIRQSRHKPGLAATLIHLWRIGEWRSVQDGRGIADSWMPILRTLVGSEGALILAAVGLSGRTGMSIAVAARFLEMPESKAWHLAVGLAAAGVLEEHPNRNVEVIPSELRAGVLNETFFAPEFPMPGYERLFELLDDKDAGLEAILHARHRGGRISDEDLLDLLDRYGNAQTWAGFVALGERQARAAMARYSAALTQIPLSLLEVLPHETIRLLLATEGDEAMAVLAKWLGTARLDSAAAFKAAKENRRLLSAEGLRYFRSGGNRNRALRAAAAALNPGLSELRSTFDGPRFGRSGLRPDDELFGELWRALLEIAPAEVHGDCWEAIHRVLTAWRHAYQVSSEEIDRQGWRSLAASAARDLAPRIRPRSREASLVALWGGDFEIDAGIETDPVLDALSNPYPFFQKVHQAMESFCSTDPERLGLELMAYDQISREIGAAASSLMTRVARNLTERAEDPQHWVKVWLALGAEPEWLQPLLVRVAAEQPPEWEALFADLLGRSGTDVVAVVALCSLDLIPSTLLPLVQQVLERYPYKLSQIHQAPIEVMRALLVHPAPLVSAHALERELLLGRPRRELAEEIKEAVRQAVRSKQESGGSF